MRRAESWSRTTHLSLFYFERDQHYQNCTPRGKGEAHRLGKSACSLPGQWFSMPHQRMLHTPRASSAGQEVTSRPALPGAARGSARSSSVRRCRCAAPRSLRPPAPGQRQQPRAPASQPPSLRRGESGLGCGGCSRSRLILALWGVERSWRWRLSRTTSRGKLGGGLRR